MNLCESLTVTAKQFPEAIALIFRGEEYSYAELDRLSRQAAGFLQNGGVSPGDRIAIQLPNCPAFVVWYYAILRLGALAVSIGTRLAEDETRFILEDSGATGWVGVASASSDSLENESTDDRPRKNYFVSVDGKVCNSEPLPKLPSSQSDSSANDCYQAEPSDAALILYTSGTTGFPKGATLSHLNVRSNVAAFNHLCQMKRGDRVLLAVPLFHCFGQNALLNSVLNVGGTLVLQERFDLNESKRLIRDYAVNQLYGVPMMFHLLLESCSVQDLQSVNYCFSAAAPLPTLTSRQWLEKFGQPIYEGYGLTETSPFASYNHRNDYVLGSIGTPIDAVEMKIVHLESGEDCHPGELGEIVIKGPNVMLGYWNRAEETAQAIRDGWFHSGDIGRVDERQFFYIVDRVKDMISIGGLKVFPAEVERVIREHPGISEVAVVGVEENVLGEQVIAFVKLNAELAPESSAADLNDELGQFLRTRLADYKMPRRFVLVDEIPRNPSGKVLKTKLREMASHSPTKSSHSRTAADESAGSEVEAVSPAPAMVFPVDQPSLADGLAKVHPGARLKFTGEFLTELVQKVSGEDQPIDGEMTFMEIGLDSLMLVELGSELQIALRSETPLPASLLFDYPTVGDLAVYLLECATDPSPRDIGDNDRKPAATATSQSKTDLVSEVEKLSEDEALDQLMKELE